MTRPEPSEVSALLFAHRHGDRSALDRLTPLVYRELKDLASKVAGSPRIGNTLQPTALAHEAWIKLAGGMEHLEGREHFFALASRAMRQILTDHARAARAQKRGGGARTVTLNESLDGGTSQELDLIALDDSLTRLSTLMPRHASVVELRFLGGLTIEETAKVLGVSTGTVDSDWAMARSWLSRELRAE